MEYGLFYEEYGEPFVGRKREKVRDFLSLTGLRYEEDIDYTVNLVTKSGELAATGSLQHNVIKCVAVGSRYRERELSSRIVTLLVNHAVEKGSSHLFLFTKPENTDMFSSLGFYPVIRTRDVLFMENARDGIKKYIKNLKRPPGKPAEPVGAIVANCSPFTSGHLYLITTAAAQCGTLHLFILSEDRSLFPAEVRYRLVKEGTEGIGNVILHHTSDYLISSAVFPAYFIKEQEQAEKINCELDLRIFCEYFARELGITRRYIGTEPFCPVTRSYNRIMKGILKEYGIGVMEIPRKKHNGAEISASNVRELLKKGNYDAIAEIVPPSTLRYLLSDEGKAIALRSAGNSRIEKKI